MKTPPDATVVVRAGGYQLLQPVVTKAEHLSGWTRYSVRLIIRGFGEFRREYGRRQHPDGDRTILVYWKTTRNGRDEFCAAFRAKVEKFMERAAALGIIDNPPARGTQAGGYYA